MTKARKQHFFTDVRMNIAPIRNLLCREDSFHAGRQVSCFFDCSYNENKTSHVVEPINSCLKEGGILENVMDNSGESRDDRCPRWDHKESDGQIK
jgi:hypothetical protein